MHRMLKKVGFGLFHLYNSLTFHKFSMCPASSLGRISFSFGGSSLSTVSLCLLLRTVQVKTAVTGLLFSSLACKTIHILSLNTCTVYCIYLFMYTVYVCWNNMYDAMYISTCILSAVYLADWEGYSTSPNQHLQATNVVLCSWSCHADPPVPAVCL